MTVDIRLTGYPDVHKLHFIQGSEAKPGRCIVDCAVGNPSDIRNSGPPRPKFADLVCETDSFQGTWKNMRVVKAIKARYGGMHVVLEDSRWILEKFKLDRNWNDRDASGRIRTVTEKSISGLVSEIVDACDDLISISVRSVPDFKPPARWAEKTCAEAIQDLLDNTGCRMVYEPETGEYVISLAGTGNLPEFPLKAYKPAPGNEWNSLKFMSSPVVYEGEVDCTAVYIHNTSGFATPLTQDTPLSLVKSATATDHAQEDYRLWKPDHTDERTYLNHRPKSILNDPEKPQYEKGRVIRDEWEPFPVHQPLVSRGNEIVDAIELTNGGVVFVTDHPVLSAVDDPLEGYNLYAKVLTGYMKKDGENGYFRDTYEVRIDPQQTGQLNIFVDWIKPIESSEPDIPSPEWQTLFRLVCMALARKYQPPPSGKGIGGVQVITTDKFYHLGGAGQVGAVEYEFAIARRQVAKSHTMRIALNFTPGTESVIR